MQISSSLFYLLIALAKTFVLLAPDLYCKPELCMREVRRGLTFPALPARESNYFVVYF
jgi:hypothetical protein